MPRNILCKNTYLELDSYVADETKLCDFIRYARAYKAYSQIADRPNRRKQPANEIFVAIATEDYLAFYLFSK